MANSGIGTFITRNQAEANLLAFLTYYKLNPSDPDMVCGHVLGLTKLYDFLRNIESYNAANPKDTIDAVRIYQARSTQTIQGKTQEVDDIFLMPILSSGTDLYPVYPPSPSGGAPEGDDDNILGGSRPCPNMCG